MAIMEYISNDYSGDDNTVLGLSTIYNAKDVSDNYDYNQYAYSTNRSKINNLKNLYQKQKQMTLKKKQEDILMKKLTFTVRKPEYTAI